MMRDRRRRIYRLKMEIESLENDIKNATKYGKAALATRLRLIREKKANLLNNWIINSNS
jgi:hypothetical protein